MQPVALNGSEMWAYVVETDEGLRVRFDIDDWQRLNLAAGHATSLETLTTRTASDMQSEGQGNPSVT